MSVKYDGQNEQVMLIANARTNPSSVKKRLSQTVKTPAYASALLADPFQVHQLLLSDALLSFRHTITQAALAVTNFVSSLSLASIPLVERILARGI
jgi:hypothetical protein